jgi:hypothetical protein
MGERASRRAKTIFVSYAHKDGPAVERIVAEMERLVPDLRVFLDRDLDVGDSFGIQIQIDRAVNAADTVVLFVSRAALASHYTQYEWQATLRRELDQEELRIIPVRLDNTRLFPFLADRQHIDARDDAPSRIAADLAAALEWAPGPPAPTDEMRRAWDRRKREIGRVANELGESLLIPGAAHGAKATAPRLAARRKFAARKKASH